MSTTKLKYDPTLEQRKKAAQLSLEKYIVNPVATVWASAEAKLPLSLALTLIDIESGGGHNEFGCDKGASGKPIYTCNTKVTRLRYMAYKLWRKAHKNKLMQGVGPTQLTYYTFQDEADSLGGCWVPWVNMYVGFKLFRSYMASFNDNEVRKAAKAYNGSDEYATAFVKRWKEHWQPLTKGASK